MLTDNEGKQIISFVRGVIGSKFSKKEIKKPENPKYMAKSGVFVTLKKQGKLRGCIGYVEPVFPLIEAVENAALASAFEDPRFPVLQESEVRDIKIEVSVLSEPKQIISNSPKGYPDEIKVGVDGLIVKRGFHSGLLLPQVAVEQRWDAKEFLSNTCVKAMLPPDAWLDSGTKVYKFQCQIFEEG